MTEAPIVVRLLSSMSTPFSLLSQQSLDTVRVRFIFSIRFNQLAPLLFPARMNSERPSPNGLISFCPERNNSESVYFSTFSLPNNPVFQF